MQGGLRGAGVRWAGDRLRAGAGAGAPQPAATRRYLKAAGLELHSHGPGVGRSGPAAACRCRRGAADPAPRRDGGPGRRAALRPRRGAQVSEDAADPELREVAGQAHASLLRVKGHASTGDLLSDGAEEAVRAGRRARQQWGAEAAAGSSWLHSCWHCRVMPHGLPVAACCAAVHVSARLLTAGGLNSTRSLRTTADLGPVPGCQLGCDQTGGALQALKKQEGEELCNCEFSLAYGARLRSMRLRSCRPSCDARMQRAWTSYTHLCACGAAHAGCAAPLARLLLSFLVTGAAWGGRQ